MMYGDRRWMSFLKEFNENLNSMVTEVKRDGYVGILSYSALQCAALRYSALQCVTVPYSAKYMLRVQCSAWLDLALVA